MSGHEHERECRRCGAVLSMWYCHACGGNPLDTVTDAYVAELATPWRHEQTGGAGRRFASEARLAA